VRATFALSIVCWAATLGCGDGVGRPIVEREAKSSTPQAGSGGGSGRGGERSFGGCPPCAGRGSVCGGGGDRGIPDGEVPDNEYCARVADWPAESIESELGLFELLNFVRGLRGPCTAGSTNTPAAPVTMKSELRCAARLHSRDMSERDFFAHVNPDGLTKEDRIRRAGYVSFRIAGESIAEGESFDGSDPNSAFQEFLNEGGTECQTLIDPAFDSVGIGRYEDYLTLDFAGP